MIRSVISGDWEARQSASRSRVWLDGVEVTHDCQVAIADEPDEAGAVLLLIRDANGRAQADANGRVLREWRRGVVRIETSEANP